jgi:NTP pyrophosphatase (non-canonical NTP hydrolase)
MSIEQITARICAFRDARDWMQFHNHKDMAAALAIEASELQELFLWKNIG